MRVARPCFVDIVCPVLSIRPLSHVLLHFVHLDPAQTIRDDMRSRKRAELGKATSGGDTPSALVLNCADAAMCDNDDTAPLVASTYPCIVPPYQCGFLAPLTVTSYPNLSLSSCPALCASRQRQRRGAHRPVENTDLLPSHTTPPESP